MTDSGVKKLPFKHVEVPLNKFNDEAVPNHLELLQNTKTLIHKLYLINDTDQLAREGAKIPREIRHLKDLLYELDSLRAQVQDSDLDKFDSQTFAIRKSINQIVGEYQALHSKIPKSKSRASADEDSIHSDDCLQKEQQQVLELRVDADIKQLQVKEREARLEEIRNVETETHDLCGVFGSLKQMVHSQKEDVEIVDMNVESASTNVRSGLKHLIQSTKFQTAMYPVTGAVVGTCVGGPIGFLAGLKFGGLAAVGGGFLGYVGGRVLKNHNNISRNQSVDCIVKSNVDSGSKKDV